MTRGASVLVKATTGGYLNMKKRLFQWDVDFFGHMIQNILKLIVECVHEIPIIVPKSEKMGDCRV